MEATTVSVITEVLFNILLGSFSLFILSGVVVSVETLIYSRRKEKRDQEAAKRDAEYHEKRMQDLLNK